MSEDLPPGIERCDIGGVVYCRICHTKMYTGHARKHAAQHIADDKRARARELVRKRIEEAYLEGDPEFPRFSSDSLIRITNAEVERRKIFEETEEAYKT